MKKDDCIFCKLANGDIPVDFIYETDKVVAFKDANPKAPIHVLVVPKNHYDSLNEIDDKALLADLLDGIRETAKKLGVKSVYVGNDFRFGKDRCGNAELLKQLGIKYGFEVHALDKYKEYDDIVSSSRIRHELGNDFEKANKMLGKNYFVYGEVVHGKHLGNTIGFPTINQVIDEEKIVPAFGVYASVVEVDGIEYAAISNLGIKPTIAGVNQLGLETFLFDYSGDLYGKWLKTSLISFVRPEMKFESIDQLKQQIAKDVEFVKNI